MPISDLEIVSSLYSGIVDGGGIEPALTLLAQRLDCSSAVLMSFDAAVPTGDVASSIGTMAVPEYVRIYHKDWARHDPGPRAFSALPSGHVATTASMFSPEFTKSNPFYNEFFHPIGLVETLGANLSSRNGHVALIGVSGERGRRPFGQSEIEALETLTPHLARALQVHRRFSNFGVKLSSLSQIVDRLPTGVIILSNEGSEIHVNRAAREIAARDDGLLLDRKGVPHCASREAERTLLKFCADVRAGGAGGIVRVPRRDEAAPYAILIAPMPSSTDFGNAPAQFAHAPNLLILIHDPDARTAATPEIIATIFALPAATARLIAAMVEGEEAKAYAERQGITMNAVKFHLKTAFAKTGLRSQARLLQTVARAIAELGERRRR